MILIQGPDKYDSFANTIQKIVKNSPLKAGSVAIDIGEIQVAVKRMIDTRLRNCKWKKNIVGNLESILSRVSVIKRNSKRG